MITINHLRTYIEDIKSKINTVNHAVLLVDDGQYASIAKEISTDKNIVLVAVIPSHILTGSEDSTEYTNQMMFFFAHKISKSDTTHDKFLDIMHQTQQAAAEFVEILLTEKSEEGTFCGIFSDVVESSINVEPFWNKAMTHGYIVEFNIK